tara:strand:+ start:443 stop:937 length:495 start_codon:yes stop_codon:yes gene_type:complete
MYSSTITKTHRSQRTRSKIWGIVIYAGISAFAFANNETGLAIGFASAAIGWLVVSNPLLRWKYRRHFKKHIAETKKGLIELEAILRIEDDTLYSETPESNGSIKYTALESLTELENLFLIKLKQAANLIIPKNKIPETELTTFMQSLSLKSDLTIEEKTTYKWR